MKKLSFVLLCCTAILAGCAKTSDIEGLQSQIDEIKNTKIASIETQITNIKSSISNLEKTDAEMQGYITTLQKQEQTLEQADKDLAKAISDLNTDLSLKITTAEANCLAELEAYKKIVSGELTAIKKSIEVLQKKDEDLQKQIDDLKTYVDNKDGEVRDWASTTFATLTEYNKTAEIVATMQGQIITINEEIEKIKQTVAGVTKEDLDKAISGLHDELKPQIQKVADDASTALTQVTENITAAYTQTIQTAISSSETSMKSWVNNQLTAYYTAAQTEAKLSALKSSLEGQMATQRTYLEGLITNLNTTLTQKIDANKTLIDGLQSQINTLSSDLSTLSGKMASNAAAISENAKQIGINALAISQNSSDIDACEKLIEENKKLIQENASAIASNDKDIADLQEMATKDEKDIAANVKAIAQNANDIVTNASLISANATAISNNAKAISDNASDIAQLQADLAQAKKDIKAAYEKYTNDAINTLGGEFRGEIATEVATLNSTIDTKMAEVNAMITALTKRVEACEKDIKSIKNTIYTIQQDIEDIQDQISAILARIQSITYVPKYSDGKAIMTYTNNGAITPGTAEFTFEMKPASTATELVKVWQSALSLKAVYTITKAAPETVTLTIGSATADNGFLTITASGIGLKDEYFKSQCAATVRLSISDGNNDLTTDYIQMVPWTTDVISFADANFKQYCVDNFDTNGDGEISEDEAKAVTAISASMQNITSLIGIEYFSNLETIDVSFNKLTSVDLTHSPKLTDIQVNGNKIQELNIEGLSKIVSLDCSNNKLGTLSVDEASDIQTLICSNNSIGALNLKNNKSIKDLECNNNNIKILELKNNTALKTLYCRKNEISVLDVTKQTGLKNFDCSSNTITALNIYGNTLLETLCCASNILTSLGVTANTKLMVLDCSGNTLTSLDVTKNTALEDLNCSNNNLGNLDISRNSALTTITCNNNASMVKLWVKDAAQKEGLSITKDSGTSIAYNDKGVTFADAKLKAYLVANYDDDSDGEISILESEDITNVNCSGKGILSLEGLENCVNLQLLDISNNSISSIVLPGLSKLTTIKCFGNPISEINIANCTSMQHFYLQNSSTDAFTYPNFRVKGYSQASSLKINLTNTSQYNANIDESNMLESIDVSDFLTLKGISTSSNTELTNVNYPSGSTLVEIYADNNPKLKAVNLTGSVGLLKLEMINSGLTSLDITNNTELTDVYVEHNSIEALDVTHNSNLVKLTAQHNTISSINVANCPKLKYLDMGDNNISSINVRNNPNLEFLSVSGDSLVTMINVDKNPNLVQLNASTTSISDLDLSNNPFLEILALRYSTISTLDISGNTSLKEVYTNSCASLTKTTYSNGAVFVPGSVVIVDNLKGVVFQTSKIISIDETICNWSNASGWCSNHGAGWYFPSKDELVSVYNAKSTLNSTLLSIGGTELGTGNYWASDNFMSQGGYHCKYYVNFTAGKDGYTSNYSSSYQVRAIRAF